MTGAKQHHSKRQLAQAPPHQRSPVTFKRGKSQLLLFHPSQAGKVEVKCSATHIRASFLKSLFTHDIESHGIAQKSAKLQLPEVGTELPKSCCVVCCIQNGITEIFCEIIVIEICQDTRVAVTHLQK